MTGRVGNRRGYIWAPLLLILGSLFLFILMKAGHMRVPQSRIHHYLLVQAAPVQRDIDRFYTQHGRLPDPDELKPEGSEIKLEAGGRLRVELARLYPKMKDVNLLFLPEMDASGISWICKIEAPVGFKPKNLLPENFREGQVWDPRDGPSMWDTFGLFILIPVLGLVMSVISLWEMLEAT